MTEGENRSLAEFGAEDPEGEGRVAEAAAVADSEGHVAGIVDPETARYPAAEEYLDLAVMQVDYTIEGSGEEEYPVVHVFGRTAGGDAEHVRVLGVEPYFYVPKDDLTDRSPEREFDAVVDVRESDASGDSFESIREEAVAKIIARTPRDVGQIREEFDRTFEADVLFPNRFLVDRDIWSGMRVPARRLDDDTIQVPVEETQPAEVTADPRVNTLDIEVDDRQGFPEDGEEPIVCLTTHDSRRDEYIAWHYAAPDGSTVAPDELPDEDRLDPDATVDVRSFEEETSMLEAVLEYVDETDPDVLTGWNFDDFDAPYLLDRLEVLGLDPDRLSRVDEVWRSGWGGPDVKGRVVFDLLYAYQRTKRSELDSYRLDDVGAEELGVGKERYEGDLGDLWEQDPERLLAYNVRDVELCVELDRQQGILAFWNEARRIVGCMLEDATTPGDAVDMYVLHKAAGKFALPSKGQQDAEEFEGGAVFDPITGVRENVSVLDLRSLYPMSMVTINASPETKVDPESYDGETYRTPSGVHFRKDPDGIIREMVDELLSERDQKKALRDDHDPAADAYDRYDRQQAAVKVIMNCFTPDTDVLTPDGVRNIRDLEVGDEVYSLDPDTEEMSVKPVTETHAYPDYRGKLVDIQTSKIDFRVTPNHRMLVRKNETNGITEEGYSFVEAGGLDRATNYEFPHDWSTDHGDGLSEIDLSRLADGDYEVWVRPEVRGHTFASELGVYPDRTAIASEGVVGYRIPGDLFQKHRDYIEEVAEQTYIHTEANRKWIPRTYDADDFLTLLAWYITEGNVYTSTEKRFGDTYRGSSTTVKIAQERTVADGGRRDHARIGALLERMGLDVYEGDRYHQFTSELLGNILEQLCGSSSSKKRIPDIVFEGDERQKREFLKTLIDCDGDRQPNSWRYSTTSQELRDDVLRLCAHLGLTASYNRDGETWRVDCSEQGKNTLRMHRSGSRSTADNGVYCVTVADNHTLLAGRNGKFQFVGQSLYGVFGWDRFRLYDREMSAGVTSTNREVIGFTEEAAGELGYDVVYGDSVTGERPVVVRDPEGTIRIIPIEEVFDRGTAMEGGTTDGRGPMKTDPSKDRRTLDGWEALSVSAPRKAEWQPIQQAIRHRTDKEVLKLQHKFGESATTRDHAYVVEDDGQLRERNPEAVSEPLRVPDIPDVEQVTDVDVYEVLSGYTRRYEDGRSVGGADARDKRKEVHADEDSVWFGHRHQGDLDSTVKVQRHIDLTGDDGAALIRLIGAYISEGSANTIETTASKFGASIAQSDRQWLEKIETDYQRIFEGADTSIIASDGGGRREVEYATENGNSVTTYDDSTLKLQMMNELSAVFFREFAGQTSRGKRIPSFIFHLPAHLQEQFIDVLVEGDGSREFPRYSEAYADRNFDFETTSRELAAGLSILLTKLGKKHSLNYRDGKDSYTIRTCDSYCEGRSPVLTEVDHDGFVYDLSVAENENFVDAVGGIVLHNTDSVMLELGPDVSAEEAIETSFDIEDHINDRYDAFAAEELNAEAHRFEIEFEKLYRRFFQAGKKKRYAGHIVWKEGKEVDDVDITGFEYKRSDIAPITKEVQREVIERIVHGEDIESVESYLHEVIEEFRAGEVEVESVGIPGGIGKRLDNYDTDTAHVRGAKYANLFLGTNFQRGSKPKRLYLEKVHPDFFERFEDEHPDKAEDPLYTEFRRDPDVICIEYADQLPEEFEVDWEKMLDKTLKGPIERVLEALDVTWEEVRAGQTQTGLSSFM